MNRNYSSASLNNSNNNNNNNNNNGGGLRASTSEVDLFQLTSNLNTLSDVSRLLMNKRNSIQSNTRRPYTEKTPEEIKKENEIIENLDKVYFDENFDSSFILESIGANDPIETIDALTVKISGYHEAVDSRFNDLIRKSYSGFVQGMSQVYEIERDLTHSARMCSSGKEYLDGVQSNLTAFGFKLLAKHRIRQYSKYMLQEMSRIYEITQTARKIDSYLNMNEFAQALELLTQWNQVITKYSKYSYIEDLTSKFDFREDTVLGKIDSSFVGVCHVFDPKSMKFVELCQILKEDQYIPSLMGILEHLSDLMWSHYMMKQWILLRLQAIKSDCEEKKFYIEIFKLFCSNKKTIWNSIQNQVRHILNSLKPKFKIELFIKVLDSINQFIEVGIQFSGEEANLLKGIMREKSLDYFQYFHKETIERLKTMLENEMWHKIPLPNNFTVLDVKEFGIIMNSFNESNLDSEGGSRSRKSSSSKPPQPQINQPAISGFLTITDQQKQQQQQLSLCPQDYEIPFLNHFKDNGNPFSLIEGRRTLSEAAGNRNSLSTSQTELPTFNNNNATTSSPLISSTTINVIKQIGYYLQMMKILKQLAYPIFTAISQLLEYYVYSVFTFFGSMNEKNTILDIANNNSNINPMLIKTLQRLKNKFSPPPVQEKTSLLSASTFQSKISSPHLSIKSDKSPNLNQPKENIFLPNLSLSNSSNSINSNSNNSNNGSNHNNGLNSLNNNFNSEEEIIINWSLPKLNDSLDLTQSKNLFGLEHKIIGLESMMFLVDCIMEAQPLVLDLIPPEKSSQTTNFYVETVSVVASLRNLLYKNITSQFLELETIPNLITNTKWELKEAPTTENHYVSSIIIQFHKFAGNLDAIASPKTTLITPKIKNLLWENTIVFAMETLIESYSKIKKCNNFGRNLMIMDVKKLQSDLEPLTTIRPIPHIKHVEHYITAYYLPRKELYEMARDSEYTVKQIISIVNIQNHLPKPEKQKLLSDLDDLEKQKLKENQMMLNIK
ncbi:hypothetical protein DICPUDRAFT_156198 [Dictyostelium purpureum]|uniref:Uncharacterized protein n=1 Tax=Dictyostelium purpureum TaxID=5786 RepID=F0ZVZ1_DICPU|nr:uncharacterized protein DICPUDRAFT_156198 [Dictyostelium purpureum]EGC31889.1 hypothetical protein DICPUDRAFT_156198 [Dictyostelium purpureum]|eukprot:XP_003291590.1 hypothetical protein DICPUDRAFT_156198 [Dictyostelium purpureum]